MKQKEDNNCDLTASTIEDLSEDDKRSMQELPSRIQEIFKRLFSNERCLIDYAISSLRSTSEINMKVLDLRLKDVDQRLIKMQDIIDVRHDRMEQSLKAIDQLLYTMDINVMPDQNIQHDLEFFENRLRNHDSKFKEIDQRSSKIEQQLERLEDEKATWNDPRIHDIEQSITEINIFWSLKSTKEKETDKLLKIPCRPVPGFQGTQLTWSYVSKIGNYLTAHNFSEVGSVDHISAFLEWTAIPTRNSFI